MARSSFLSELRKQAGLTQDELGKKIGLPDSYAQKKVSQWESDLTRPNAAEIDKLSKVLKVPLEELRSYFADRNSRSTVELFSRLAVLDRPALLAVCYSGRPRVHVDAFVRAKYEEALKRNLFVAMFVPFPMTGGDTSSGSSLLLTGYSNRVWGSIFALNDKLRSSLGDREFTKHRGTYGPKVAAKPDSILVPPFLSRYALLLEKNKRGDYDRTLYLWVETAENKQVQLIGTSDNEGADEQIQSWEAYFEGVITSWMKDNVLPTHDSGYWRYIKEANVR